MGVALAGLASGVGLSACGGTTEATSATLSAAVAKPAASGVAVSPQPGTPDASPTTQISFLGGAGTQVSDVHVVGSHSGTHGGVLRAYSTGTGESFLPSKPFSAGEKVTVHADVGGAALGTSFTIAHQAPVSQKEFPLNPGDSKAIQHYSTAPSLTRFCSPPTPTAARAFSWSIPGPRRLNRSPASTSPGDSRTCASRTLLPG